MSLNLFIQTSDSSWSLLDSDKRCSGLVLSLSTLYRGGFLYIVCLQTYLSRVVYYFTVAGDHHHGCDWRNNMIMVLPMKGLTQDQYCPARRHTHLSCEEVVKQGLAMPCLACHRITHTSLHLPIHARLLPCRLVLHLHRTPGLFNNKIPQAFCDLYKNFYTSSMTILSDIQQRISVFLWYQDMFKTLNA